MIAHGNKANEDGNILVLSIGYVVVIVLAALLTVTLSGIYLERNRLINVGDAAALVASDYAAKTQYLASRGAPSEADRSGGATEAVASFLQDSGAASKFTKLELVAVDTSGATARVTLRSRRSVLAAFDLDGPGAFALTLSGTGVATAVVSGN